MAEDADTAMAEAEKAGPRAEDSKPEEAEEERWKRRRIEGEAEAEKTEDAEDKGCETNGDKSWQQKDWEEKEDNGWEANGDKNWQQKDWEEEKEDNSCETNGQKSWQQKDWEEEKEAADEEPKAEETGEKTEGEVKSGEANGEKKEDKDASEEKSGEATEEQRWDNSWKSEEAMDTSEEKSGDANGEKKEDKADEEGWEEKSGEKKEEKSVEKEGEAAEEASEEKAGEKKDEKSVEKEGEAAEEASEEKSGEKKEEKSGEKEGEAAWSKDEGDGWGSGWGEKEWDKKEDWDKGEEATEAKDGEAKADKEDEKMEEEAKEDEDADEEEEWKGTLKLDIGWEDAAWLLENDGKRIKGLEELSGADVKVREAGSLRLRPREGAAPAAASASWAEECAKALCAMRSGGDVEVHHMPPAGPCSGLPLTVVEVPAAVPLNFVKGKNGNRLMEQSEEMGVVAVFVKEGWKPEGEKEEEEEAKPDGEKEELPLEVGGKVEAKYGNSFFEATVVEVGESLVKVKWGFDGSEEEVARENVKAGEAQKKEEPKLEVGGKVEGKYGNSWFEATLVEVGDNIVKVTWGFDGSEEELARTNVRAKEEAKKEEEAPKKEEEKQIEPGMTVQGKYGAEWLEAEVLAVDGSLIKVRWGFDSSEEELAKSNVKIIPPPEEPPQEPEEPPNKVFIYGSERGRMVMELRLMNLMELKAPGCLANKPRREDECEGLGWSHTQLKLEGKARGRLIGKGGSMRKRISKISGSYMEYVGDYARVVGTGEERQRTVSILDMLQGSDGFQIKALPSVFEADCTRLKLPKDAAGSVTGQRRGQLNHVEDETGTLVFMEPASAAKGGGAERLTLQEGATVEGKCKGEWLEATVLKVMNWSADDDDEDDETDGRTVTLKWAKDGREAIVPMTVVREKLEGEAAVERARLEELANSVTLVILGPERSRQIAQLRIMNLVEAGKPGTFSAEKLASACSARVKDLSEEESQRCQSEEVLARMDTVALAAGCIMWPVGRSLCLLGSEEACVRGQEYVRPLLVSSPSLAEVDAMPHSSYSALLVPKDKSKNLTAQAMALVEAEFEIFAYFDDGAGLAGIEDSVRVIVCGRDETKREAALEKLKVLQDVEQEQGTEESWGEKPSWDEKKDWEEKKEEKNDWNEKKDWEEKKDWDEKKDWEEKKEDSKWGEKKWDEKSSWNEDSKDSKDSKGWGGQKDWQSNKSWDDKAGRDEGQAWKEAKASSSWGESKEWEKKSSWDEDKDWKKKGGWGESNEKDKWGDRDKDESRSWDSKKRSWPEDDWKSSKRGREAEQDHRDSRDQGRGNSDRQGRDNRSWTETSGQKRSWEEASESDRRGGRDAGRSFDRDREERERDRRPGPYDRLRRPRPEEQVPSISGDRRPARTSIGAPPAKPPRGTISSAMAAHGISEGVVGAGPRAAALPARGLPARGARGAPAHSAGSSRAPIGRGGAYIREEEEEDEEDDDFVDSRVREGWTLASSRRQPPEESRRRETPRTFVARQVPERRPPARRPAARPSDPKAVLDDIGWPELIEDWEHVQDVVFQNHSKLPAGWIRIWSRSQDCEYYMRTDDHRSTFELDEVFEEG